MDNGLAIAIVSLVMSCLCGICVYTARKTYSKKPVEEMLIYDALPTIPEEELV
jgi:hypothetical protein